MLRQLEVGKVLPLKRKCSPETMGFSPWKKGGSDKFSHQGSDLSSISKIPKTIRGW